MQILKSAFVILKPSVWQQLICTHSIQLLLSHTLSKASLVSCDSCPSIAHYAQLSQVCLYMAVILTLNLDWANLTLFQNCSFMSAPIPKEIPE